MKLFCFKCKKETDFFGLYTLRCVICHLSPGEAMKKPLKLVARPKS